MDAAYYPQVPPPPWAWPTAAAAPAQRRGPVAVRFIAILWLLLLFAVVALVLGSRAVLGWMPYQVVSGSMVPAVQVGDLVLVEPKRPGVPFGPPTIITFLDDRGRTVTHRVEDARRGVDGEVWYTTKGDANPGPDSDAVPHGRVRGSVRMVLRGAGLPHHWLANGRPGPLAALVVVTLAAAWLSVPRGRMH
jgi:signal peptidase I